MLLNKREIYNYIKEYQADWIQLTNLASFCAVSKGHAGSVIKELVAEGIIERVESELGRFSRGTRYKILKELP